MHPEEQKIYDAKYEQKKEKIDEVIKIIQLGKFSAANIKIARKYFEEKQPEVTTMMVAEKSGSIIEQYIQKMRIQKLKKG